MTRILRPGVNALCFFFLTQSILCVAQTQNFVSKDTNYINNVLKAQKALDEDNFVLCNQCFTKALLVNQSSASTLFDHGYCFFKRNLLDSAGFYWGKATTINFDYVWTQVEDEKLLDTKWRNTASKLFNSCMDTFIIQSAQYDTALIRQLKRLSYLDQCYRGMSMDSIRKQYGRGSKEELAFAKKRNAQDSINLIEVNAIFKRYNGYPTKKQVGTKYVSTPFMVIQHDPNDKQETYLPMLKAAAEAGDLNFKTLALLIDRVKVQKGKKQLYGTQLFYNNASKKYDISPVENPETLNDLRKSIGLGTIEDYVNGYNERHGKH
jgi:hypothetical protein